MSTFALTCSALSFLQDHENEHLSGDRQRLVDRCIEHLVNSAGISTDTARTVTLQALGELSARRSKVSIDCTRTTSFTLFMKDESGQPVVLVAADLAELAKQASLTPLH